MGLHSVETIRFEAPAAAIDSFVIKKIRGAELLFIAGGDQFDYYQLWKDGPIQDAINYLFERVILWGNLFLLFHLFLLLAY